MKLADRVSARKVASKRGKSMARRGNQCSTRAAVIGPPASDDGRLGRRDPAPVKELAGTRRWSRRLTSTGAPRRQERAKGDSGSLVHRSVLQR